MFLFEVHAYTFIESWQEEQYSEKKILIVASDFKKAEKKAKEIISSTYYDRFKLKRIEIVDGYKIHLEEIE